MSASERARRNADMAARKSTGATWEQIAAEFGVAKSTARKGVTDHLAAGGTVLPADPLAVSAEEALRDALDTYSWALAALRTLASEADNSSARVGAIRAAVGVVERRIETLMLAGVIPSADTQLLLRVDQEKREFARAVVDVLRRIGVDWEPVDAELARLLPSPGARAVAA